MNADKPIGVFDSGVGGLSVLRAIRQTLPDESVLYFADQAHVPYGPRPLEEVRGFSEAIVRFLLEQGAKLIVVACNTASAAALQHLRKVFSAISFVGMEPAIKPAAETTRSGIVGVLATPATFQGALYASVVERFAGNVTLLQDTCPGLVQQIERGELDARATRSILESALRPMLDRGIDTVVLGCTHYPFVIPLIQEIVGPAIRVIDRLRRWHARPAACWIRPAAVSRPRVREAALLYQRRSGAVKSLLPDLLGENGEVQQIVWAGGGIRYSGDNS